MIYDVVTDQTTTQLIHDGDAITVENGVTVSIPKPFGPAGERNAIWSDGGNNLIVNHGLLTGFNVFSSLGGDHMINAADGVVHTQNAGFEVQGSGNNVIENYGLIKSSLAICIGPNPEHSRLPIGYDGDNTITNAAGANLVGTHGITVRVDGGGNLLTNDGAITNTGDISPAVAFWSTDWNVANTVINTGTIQAGGLGVALDLGDAPAHVTNTGIITGDILFGPGDDSYIGVNKADIDGTIFGGAGNDFIHVGNSSATVNGGTGVDTLWAGRGHEDVFVFAPGDSPCGSSDTVEGFKHGMDELEFTGYADDERASFHVNAAGDTVVHIGHDAIVLTGVIDLHHCDILVG